MIVNLYSVDNSYIPDVKLSLGGLEDDPQSKWGGSVASLARYEFIRSESEVRILSLNCSRERLDRGERS